MRRDPEAVASPITSAATGSLPDTDGICATGQALRHRDSRWFGADGGSAWGQDERH